MRATRLTAVQEIEIVKCVLDLLPSRRMTALHHLGAIPNTVLVMDKARRAVSMLSVSVQTGISHLYCCQIGDDVCPLCCDGLVKVFLFGLECFVFLNSERNGMRNFQKV